MQNQFDLEKQYLQYQQMCEFAPLGMIYIDSSWHIVHANNAFCRMLDISTQKAEGFDLKKQLRDDTMRQAVEDMFTKGQSHFEGSYDSILGKKHLYLRVRFYKDDKTQSGGVAVFEDLTEKKLLQEQVAQKSALYEQLFNANKAVMLFIDPNENGRIIEANQKALEFYGYTQEELLQKSIYELNTLTQKQIQDEMQHAIKQKRNQFNFKHRLKNGEIKNVEVFSGPIQVNDKELLYSIIHDITQQHLLEEELYKQHEYLQNVVNGMQNGLSVIDENYNILLMNSAAKQLLNTRHIKDTDHPKCYEVSHHRDTPCDSLSHICPLEEVKQTGKAQKVIHHHYDTNDQERLVEVTLTPLKDKMGNIYAFVEYTNDITDIINMQEAIKHQTHYDLLTSLPNRKSFMTRIDSFIAQASKSALAAIILIDLDHFKEINDSFGHREGDNVIKKFASWLKKHIEHIDTLSRFGGDSFAILLENITDDMHVTHIIENLKAHVDTHPVTINKQKIHISFSAGIAIYPQDGATSEILFKNADAALYEAKEQGRNTYAFYTHDLSKRALERVTMTTNIREALELDAFVLYYQPQYDCINERIIGFEALIRWNHNGTLISPAQFIPLLESTKLIIPVGRIIMHKAFSAAKALHDAKLDVGVISINLSMVQLETGQALVDDVKDILHQTNCHPEWIGLEITESVMMKDTIQILKTLNELAKLGCTISIDDFGTGYSSLAYLKKMPIKKLKIDQSFVRDLPHDEEDSMLTKTIISLAQNMRLEVIAEGVETQAQQEFLTQHGCSQAQGFLYNKPLSFEAMQELLTNSKT